MKKKTTKEYKEQIKNLSFLVLDEYINGSTKINHQCKTCEYIWKVRPNSIKRESGCPNCSKYKLMTTEKYKEQIKNLSFLVIDKYKGGEIKIKHQCLKCEHIWKAKPGNIKTGYGCPACSANKTAYEKYKDVPTWLYYIFIPSKNLYKIGVSMDRNGGTHGRYKREKFQIKVLREELFTDGYEAYKLEQKIIQVNKQYAWSPSKDEKFVGWTECFVENLIV